MRWTIPRAEKESEVFARARQDRIALGHKLADADQGTNSVCWSGTWRDRPAIFKVRIAGPVDVGTALLALVRAEMRSGLPLNRTAPALRAGFVAPSAPTIDPALAGPAALLCKWVQVARYPNPDKPWSWQSAQFDSDLEYERAAAAFHANELKRTLAAIESFAVDRQPHKRSEGR